MKNKIIAIQGAEGSNHHKVARDFYGTSIQLKECMSFDVLVASLLDQSSNLGIMALENTIAGSIIPNYALIDNHNLHIIGEEYLNIHHHLMALKGQKIEDIKEVWSHPMALLQCKEFFKKHPHIKLIEDVDTAEVAKRIAKENLVGIAAIAPKIAAEIFDLTIIEDEIQTMKDNSTRFVIVQTEAPNNGIDQINKASLKFILSII
jgi:prephenate dehydratase